MGETKFIVGDGILAPFQLIFNIISKHDRNASRQ